MPTLFHIDLFMPLLSRYGVLHHFTEEFLDALERQNQKCRLLIKDPYHPELFLKSLMDPPPDFTLTFNALEPDPNGTFLCDMLKIPHFSFLVDSPNYFFSLIKGSIDSLKNTTYNIMSCPDRDSCAIFRELGFDRVFFLPHGVKKNLRIDVEADRPYDVAMLASLINFEKIQDDWKEQYPSKKYDLLMESASLAFKFPERSYLRSYAFVNSLLDSNEHVVPEIVRHYKALDELEKYVRGVDRAKLIQSVRSAKVDIFGEGMNGNLFGNLPNLRFHEPVPFHHALEVMGRSKIVLNSCSWIRDGGHERVFSAMACGALVISTRTAYLEEMFKENEEILFYDFNNWENVDALVAYYLSHDKERREMAFRGQQKVLNSHTWDNRAKVLIEEVSSLLQKSR